MSSLLKNRFALLSIFSQKYLLNISIKTWLDKDRQTDNFI